MAAPGDEELKLLLGELKSTQKALVLPIFLSLGLTLQSFTEALEPLKPLGWYGSIHSLSAFLFTLWQDVPDLAVARQRSQYRAHIYLLLNVVGFAACAAIKAANEDLLYTMVLVFLLPITSALEVRSFEKMSDVTPFQTYLVLHFAMTCAQFREDFMRTGWKFVLASLIVDVLLNCMVTERVHMRRQLLDGTCTTIRRLLTTACDGCCVVASSGEIVFADLRLADLMGGPEVVGLTHCEELDGLPFSMLLQVERGSAEKQGPIAEGSRVAKLKVAEGLPPMTVEIYTVRCSMPAQVISLAFGRKGHPPIAGRNVYLCMLRQTASQPSGASGSVQGLGSGGPQLPGLNRRKSDGSDVGSRLSAATLEQLRHSAEKASGSRGPRLEESALERLRQSTGGLGPSRPSPKSHLGSEVGHQSQVGRRCDVSEVGRCSEVSGFSAASSTFSNRHESASALTLANRRLQLMGQSARGGPMLDRGTPMILELDLPVSEVSSVVSENISNVQGQSGSGALNVRMRMQSRVMRGENGQGDGGSSGSEGEEMQTTEVRSIGTPTAEGTVRVQLAFRSQFLSKQQARLDSSEMELRRARHEMTLRDEVQEEQKAVLKKFQKIVTREFDNMDDGLGLNVTVFVLESREAVRSDLSELCERAGFSARVFSDVTTAKSMLHEESGLYETNRGLATAAGSAAEEASTVGMRTLRRPVWRRECGTQLVLLGAPLLDQLRAEWREAGIFVVLVGMPEELESVGKYLGASNQSELRDTLRALGVSEHVEVPLHSGNLRSLAEGALRHRFGGDFLLVQHFGRGATGPVYGAKRLRDGEVFAIKEVNTAKLHKPTRSSKTASAAPPMPAVEWREVEILAAARWPTVMHLIDSWSANGGKLVYILMPALVGGTVADQIEKAAASKTSIRGDQVGEWYAQVLHGLAYLHWCGVLHRDLKTDNLLLDINNRSLRIADFGSAVLLPGEGPHPQRRNCLRGDVTTIRITSPEVFSGRLWYPASDVWAVGATFYEVLTSKPLLPAERPADELLELASAMDELPERSAAAAAAGDVESTRGKLPADVISAYIKLLRQAAPVSTLATELPELLRRNPLRRPTVSSLCVRPRAAMDLRRALEAGALWERAARMRHLSDFDRLLAESNSAAEQEPPPEAAAAAAAAEATIAAAKVAAAASAAPRLESQASPTTAPSM